MQANKKEKIIEKLISLLINTDKKKIFNHLSKKDKKEIFKYLENELFNLGEIKELLSSIKYDKIELHKSSKTCFFLNLGFAFGAVSD